VKVVKAFNTTFATTLLAGVVVGQRLDVFIAGDEAVAKSKVAERVKNGAIRIVDIGPLGRALRIEGMQFLHIVEQSGLGTNWASTIENLS
jgi:predicted dinucleotide-binding enzyme